MQFFLSRWRNNRHMWREKKEFHDKNVRSGTAADQWWAAKNSTNSLRIVQWVLPALLFFFLSSNFDCVCTFWFIFCCYCPLVCLGGANKISNSTAIQTEITTIFSSILVQFFFLSVVAAIVNSPYIVYYHFLISGHTWTERRHKKNKNVSKTSKNNCMFSCALGQRFLNNLPQSEVICTCAQHAANETNFSSQWLQLSECNNN